MKAIPSDPEVQRKLVHLFSQAPLFQGLTPDRIGAVLNHATLVQFEQDEVVLQEGDPSTDLYLLVKGEVSIRVAERRTGEPVELNRLKPPETLGEMGLLLQTPRSASAVAVGQLLALRFENEVFEAMCQKLPFFGLTVARALARRLSQTSHQMQLPAWEGDTPPGPEVVSLLPMDLIQRHRVMPLALEGNTLVLGFVDDPGTPVLSAVRDRLSGLVLRTVSLSYRRFEALMQTMAGVTDLHPAPTAAPEPPVAAPVPKAATVTAPSVPRGSSPRLDALLKRMVAEGASDLHLSGNQAPRWRIDGHIKTIEDARPMTGDEILDLLMPIMDERAREAIAAHDCDFAYEIAGTARFRVNAFRDHCGVGTVMRVIPSKILTFEQLGLPKVVEGLCENPKGLVLVTGPTGSGKSTTLAAMIDAINKRRADHIITLEDPIEFVHKSQKCLVNQREIGAHTASYARALKAALREDPDIVLVGEMRDIETVSLALETANTGHLVFGTLHTATAVSTIDRIINLFTPEQQSQVRASLADVLRGVVAQTLCRKIGGGRVAALEVLVVSYAISNMIREGKNHQIASAMSTGKGLGNMTLNEELSRLVTEKKVEYEEALAKAVDKIELAKRCGKGGDAAKA